MFEFLESNGGLVATVVMVMLGLNALLMGIYKALEIVKDKTAGNGDNKAYEAIGKVIAVLQKIIDFVSTNRKH